MFEMKVLLRSTKARLYYLGPRQWTAKSDSAFDFEEVGAAIKMSREAGLTDVEVVLSDHDPQAELVLPLSLARGSGTR